MDSTINRGNLEAKEPLASVLVLGVNVTLTHASSRRPSLKLLIDRQTINKHEFDINSTELKWEFDSAYVFHDGPPLTIQLRERSRLQQNKPILERLISFEDAHKAISLSPEGQVEHTLVDNPKVTFILASSGKGWHLTPLQAGIKVLEKRKNVLDHLGKSRRFLETVLKSATALSEVHPVTTVVLASVNTVYKLLKEQEKCNEVILDLAKDMADTLGYVEDVEQFARLVQLVEAINEVRPLMEKTTEFIIQYSSRSLLANAMHSTISSSHKDQIDSLKAGFGRFKRKFDRGVAVQSAITLDSLLASTQDDKILAILEPRDVKGGSLVEECMEGTRQDILSAIDSWADNFNAPNILWVKGHPGVGKSTIISSVVKRLRGNMRLGSTFCFQRANATILTPHALWRTVAYDLAQQYPIIRKKIVTKIEADRNLPTTGNLNDLFERLVQQPLTASGEIPVGRLPIIVIDALDECGGLEGQRSDHRRTILRTFTKWSALDPKFKIIVTSRAEADIESTLRDISRPIEVTAGSNTTLQSSADIQAFLTSRFREIADPKRYPSMKPDWPGSQVIQQLTTQAGGLFIWAKVVINFIYDGEPWEQLDIILKGNSGTGNMARLYAQILNTSFPKPSEKLIEAFQSILCAVILCQIPLSAASLTHLLSAESRMVEHICDRLNSVMESRDILRISHQSFTDFLIDQTACPSAFRINLEDGKRRVTLACLWTMKNGLRFNICDLKSSYMLNAEVSDMEMRVEGSIPPHLSYSCWYWGNHLITSKENAEILELLDNFMTVQFLFWLEVLSVTKRVNLACGMISSLIYWIQKYGQDDAMAIDLRKFVKGFAAIISKSVPHIYLSALPFTPRQTPVSKQYLPSYPKTIRARDGGQLGWQTIHSVFEGHSDKVMSVVFSPDGKHIVSGSDDKTIRIWDAETGEMLGAPLKGHTDFVRSVAFSPDGKRIVSGSRDCTIRLWDAETGEPLGDPLEGHAGSVNSVAFSPGGERIASGSRDSTIRMWDAATGEVVGEALEGHHRAVGSVAFSPDGKLLVSGSADKTIRLWNAQTGEAVGVTLKANDHYDSWVSSVAFSPDGKRILSGSGDHKTRLWNAETGEALKGPLEEHGGSVYSVAFSPDGERIASGYGDNRIRLWDAQTGEALGAALEGHDNWLNSVAFSPDGKRLVSGSGDKTVRLWDVEMGEASRFTLEGHDNSVYSVAFSPDGKRLVSGSVDRTIRLWNAETGDALGVALEGHGSWLNSVAFSPDGKRIASGSADKTIRLWDAEKGEALGVAMEGHDSDVNSVAFSPDGKRLVSGSADKTIRLWNAETGEALGGPSHGHTSSVHSVAFSPDGERMASGSRDNTIRMWDAKTGETLGAPLTGHTDRVQCVAFSPDGTRVASGSGDMTIRLWNAETGEAVGVPLTGHTGMVTSVAFLTDGTRIVSGSRDKMIRVWNVGTGEKLGAPLSGHTGWVCSVAFCPDGKRIVSGSHDRTIRLWDAETGEALGGALQGHGERWGAATVSSDDKRIAPGSDDGTIRGRDMELCNGRNTSLFNSSSRIHEGWILDSHSNRLFWVPPWLHIGLMRPGNTVIIGKVTKTQLDLEEFEHGESWTRCRGPVSSSS